MSIFKNKKLIYDILIGIGVSIVLITNLLYIETVELKPSQNLEIVSTETISREDPSRGVSSVPEKSSTKQVLEIQPSVSTTPSLSPIPTPPPSIPWERDIPLSLDIQEYIYNQCINYNFDYNLILGIMKVESEFRIGIVSRTQDIGLMQINKRNQSWVNKMAGRQLNLYNAKDNTLAGLLILTSYKKQWENKIDESILTRYTLSSYHMGVAGFRNSGCPINTFYVNSILNQTNIIKGL